MGVAGMVGVFAFNLYLMVVDDRMFIDYNFRNNIMITRLLTNGMERLYQINLAVFFYDVEVPGL